jgi:CheY-like chemotaxis protein
VTGTVRWCEVFIVDDHRLFLSGVRAEMGEAFEIVGEAATAKAPSRDRRGQPDVVLVDVHMPGGRRRGGRAVGRTHPDIRFLALSASDAAEDVIAVIRSGARGTSQGDLLCRPGRRRPARERRGCGVLPAAGRIRAGRVRGLAGRRCSIPSSTA